MVRAIMTLRESLGQIQAWECSVKPSRCKSCGDQSRCTTSRLCSGCHARRNLGSKIKRDRQRR